jgi:hypothetical protein
MIALFIRELLSDFYQLHPFKEQINMFKADGVYCVFEAGLL